MSERRLDVDFSHDENAIKAAESALIEGLRTQSAQKTTYFE